ncbi:MAG: c-type cytochrome [Myxococcaceae bacterium]|nr:c-type cytochrome [Myxococcaceae bacterium]
MRSFLAVTWLTCSAALAQPAPSAVTRHAALLGPLVELSGDYMEAIETGDPRELDKQRALAHHAAEEAARLSLPPKARADLEALVRAVDAVAPPAEVHQRSRALIELLRTSGRFSPAPARAPDLARAAKRYAQLCGACHGEQGKGDGAAAATQHPPPVSFQDDDVMNPLSPLDVFFLLTSGSFESAMPSFEALSDEERWELAFFVFTLRHAACPAPAGAPVPLAELARLSDGELNARRGEAAVGCLRTALRLPGRQ